MSDPKPQEMDIVDFVEEVCEIKLLDYQKTFIRKLYENKDKADMRLIFARGRSTPSWFMAYMFCIAAMRKEGRLK